MTNQIWKRANYGGNKSMQINLAKAKRNYIEKMTRHISTCVMMNQHILCHQFGNNYGFIR